VNVVPLAADSLGVRSMATYVECGQTRILIDPGAVLAPSRFGLPPADEEWEALRRANDRISAYAERAGSIFLSHYHEDHFRYDPALYRGHTVWAKDARRMINPRQAQRAGELWKSIESSCRLDSAEGRVMETAEARLSASPPLAHGAEGTGLGYVVALTVTDLREGKRFVHASDVQGPLSAVAAAYLIRERPDLLYLSGPPAYLEGQLGAALIDQGVDHLLRVIDQTGCRVILDHHALRAESYPDRFRSLWRTGRVVTAAGYLGLEDAALESRRRALWTGKRKPAASMPGRLKTRGRSAMIEARANVRRARGGAIE
jgi:predicted metallo-beta-lactamase superfamily hydrolase